MVAIAGLSAHSGVKVELEDSIAVNYYIDGTTWLRWVNADGIASKTLVQEIAHNAYIRQFTVSIGATRADGTTLDNSGQVRLQTDSGGSKIIVVDFGMLRTVSGVGRVAVTGPSMTICSLQAFRGDAFDPTALYEEDCSSDIDGASVRTAAENTFETRTEKVRLTVKTSAALPAISSALFLQFPDLPSDLDIRINGGAPAFSSPGVAQPNTHGWDANGAQTVDITAALQALCGDPHDSSALTANIALNSRIPGLLALQVATADIAYLSRVSFNDSEDTTLSLDSEGAYDVVLAVPDWVKQIQEVQFLLTATVPPERTLPPVGPPRALMSGGTGAAYDLLLDVDHAAAARLDAAAPFADLTGVRLPLRAGVDGAEVRAVLYKGTSDSPSATPVDGGTSTPVSLESNPDATSDVWSTFSFPAPVKLDHTATYWVVVVTGRGGVSWSLGSFSSSSTAVPIRRGAATGPWYGLPSVIAGSAAVGARIRATGRAPSTAPIAPISVTLAGHETSQIAVTPGPKGVAAVLTPGPSSGTTHPSVPPDGAAGSHNVTLRLTSSMLGSVKVSAVDVVATK